MKIENEINFLVSIIDKELKKYLQNKKEFPHIIWQAMRYSVFAGGKRLRPLLALFTAKTLNMDYRKALPFACALEMIHTYSLIHDDLPAMDNDDFRRGKLTSHKKFGEAIAILAGDALLNRAFEITIENALKNKMNYKNVLDAIYEIANASGINGMISGQVMDIISENKNITKKVIEFLHSHKTGALIKASVVSIAKLCGVNRKLLHLFNDFGIKIGLAFQIVDDILDEIGEEKKLGKRLKKDKEKGKATYPKIYGLKKSILIAKNLILEAKKILSKIKGKTDGLNYIAEYIINQIN